jgi:hypothetical protein
VALPYSQSFGIGVTQPNVGLLLFTAASSGVWELRDLVLTNQTNAAQAAQLYFLLGGVAYHVFNEPALPAQTSAHQDLRVVLPAGAQLYAQSSGVISAVLTGYHLTTN